MELSHDPVYAILRDGGGFLTMDQILRRLPVRYTLLVTVMRRLGPWQDSGLIRNEVLHANLYR